MKLEDIAAEVRPRQPWEAIDLGFTMVRSWWRPIFGAWLSTVIPLSVIIALVLHKHLWIAVLIVWWLKPLYDRIVLHVLSRAMFGDPPSVGETLRTLPELVLHTRLLLALTLYRLDPARAFNLPVWQLEGGRGRRRRERSRVLARNTQGTAVGLIFACINFELVLFTGLAILLWNLIPNSLHPHISSLIGTEHATDAAQALWDLLYLTAMSAVEPFYVAGGFALYLNRRTLLEGWDIEIAFRRIAERTTEPTGRTGGPSRFVATWLLAAALCLAGLPGTPAQAASNNAAQTGTAALNTSHKTVADPNPKQAKQLIKEVLAQPAFRTWRTEKRWHYIGAKSKPHSKNTSSSGTWSLSWLGQILALVGETLLAVGLVTLVAMLIVHRQRWLTLFGRGAHLRKRAHRPDVLFGMDVRPESLPVDVAGSAWRLWREGRRVEAMSLLYRGALATLIDRDGLELGPGATEGDCLRLVQERPGGATAGYFAQLTRTWQNIAYAHRTPGDTEAQLLCTNWPRHFATAATAQAPQAPAEGAA